MKFILFFLTFACFLMGLPVTVAAQADWSVRPQHSLSISLNGLKESAARMRHRNEWLTSEIQVLEMKLEGAASGPATAQRPRTVGRYHPQGAMPSAPLSPVEAVDPKLLSGMQEQRLLQEIAAVEQDIRTLSSALQGAEITPVPSENEYEARVAQARSGIKALTRQLQDFERGSGAAWEEFKRLQSENLQLKEKRAALQERYQNFALEADALTKDLETVDQRLAQEIEQAREAVSELSSSKQRLDQVLKKVDLRIDGKRERLRISDQEIELLMENRHFIQAENTSLKEQFSRLQEDWKEIQKSAKK